MAVESAYGTPEELRSVVDELAQLVTIETTLQGNLFSEENEEQVKYSLLGNTLVLRTNCSRFRLNKN